eukprot:TRINITY_DN77822_c0_g1_i1.p1 TRINITY_DN77822_c0_g1~~TRINITY_DN77822_c0_g1_i1.p1  ORF type:complete len:393 (+),score=62.84 TRINITY_DN77822_c0_g1_i1:33-1181(+)
MPSETALLESLPNNGLSVRSGHEVPGYTGYIPGKGPEMANMGKRFAAANADGLLSARGERPVQDTAKVVRGVNKAIPGYSGHLPGKVEDSYAAGWTSANARAHAPHELPIQTPRAEVRPGEGVVSGSQAPVKLSAALSPRVAEAKTQTPRPGTTIAAVSVPGYSGHVPGTEDIVGARFAAKNAIAAVEFNDQDKAQRQAWRGKEAPGAEHRKNIGASKGMAVPGYTGWVHGKRPEADVMGMRFRAANEAADTARIHLNASKRKERAPQPAAAQQKHYETRSETAQSVRSSQASRSSHVSRSSQASKSFRNDDRRTTSASVLSSRSGPASSVASTSRPGSSSQGGRPKSGGYPASGGPSRPMSGASKAIPGYGGFKPQNHTWI